MLLALALQVVIEVTHDDVVVRESCTLVPSEAPIHDANGDGVVQIVGDDIVVQFGGTALVGADATQAADTFSGIGVRITGKRVVVRGAQIGGFKCAIRASGADGLLLEGCNVSGNYRQRLKSTPRAEDGADWLYPHENDDDRWATNHGAGIYVAESRGVTIRNCFARAGQNGICLRRVDDSRVYDNDMSWMSGWGLALYRSSGNVIDHNSFDFCIRGYSDGVYARGQDSAGILAFEQCSNNLIAFNSATHGGDGFFGFAGLEALDRSQRAGQGCNANLLYGNDFSYAAAIGIEMTFSFGNTFAANRLVGSNYGVWGGYSQSTTVFDNEIAENTISGIAVEHGSHWLITRNRFARNARAIELWWNDNPDLMSRPWAKLNGSDSKSNEIYRNEFAGEKTLVELRGGAEALFDALSATDKALVRVDDKSKLRGEGEFDIEPGVSDARLASLPGKRAAVGARKALDGRDKIIVTEWGPYDWSEPYLQRVADRGAAHAWRLLGDDIAIGVDAGPDVAVRMDASVAPPVLLLTPREPGVARTYELRVRVPSRTLVGSGVLLGANWRVTFGRWKSDPRTAEGAWRAEVAQGVSFETSRLAFAFGSAGPSALGDVPQSVKDAALGGNQFGTLATTSITLPAGTWKLATTSDDGVRVRWNGAPKIENWTHHGPTVDTAEIVLERETAVRLEVEHFELDGWAVLELELERIVR